MGWREAPRFVPQNLDSRGKKCFRRGPGSWGPRFVPLNHDSITENSVLGRRPPRCGGGLQMSNPVARASPGNRPVPSAVMHGTRATRPKWASEHF